MFTISGNPTIELQGYGGLDNDASAIEAFFDTVATNSPAVTGSFFVGLFAGTSTGTVSAPGGTVPVPSF